MLNMQAKTDDLITSTTQIVYKTILGLFSYYF